MPRQTTQDDRAGALLQAGDLRAAAEAVVRDHGPQILGYLISVTPRAA